MRRVPGPDGPLPVIMDTDPGHDDAIAIMLACGAPELDVLAVTTVAGNVGVEKTTRNALGVLSAIGRDDVPVAAGASEPLARPSPPGGAEGIHGKEGLGGMPADARTRGPDWRGAVRLIADVIGGSEEPVTLVPTGPLTNVARFMEEYPELKANVGRIVLMGGSVGAGNATPAAEFNVYFDPEAARIVFGSGLPITMVGLEVGRAAAARPEEIERLRFSGGAAADVAAKVLTSYANLYESATGKNAPPLFDAVAAAAVVEPGILATSSIRIEVECAGEHTLGETVCDLEGRWERPPNADVGLELDVPAFFAVLHRSLGGPAGAN